MFHSSLNTTTVWEQHPRPHHNGATDAITTSGKGRVRTGDRWHPVLCLCQLGQDIPEMLDVRMEGLFLLCRCNDVCY